jgi:hypothetical protein
MMNEKIGKIDLDVIPCNMTSQLQVLDEVINKPFKGQFRRLYKDWLLNGNMPSLQVKKWWGGGE